MSERAAYSRVYWTVMDDPKFDGIREDVRHFGSWSLLLIVADMAWPAPAYVPVIVPRASYRALVAAQLIDELPGGRFRIHGLDSERSKRRDAATRPFTSRPPTGTQPGPNRDPVAEQDENETRKRRERDETSARESLPGYDGRADLEAFVLLKRRPPTDRQRQLLDSVLQLHDLTGPQWAADIMLAHPEDPVAALIEADKAWRHERIELAKAAERKPTPLPRSRSHGLTGINAEIAKAMRELEANRKQPA